MHCPECGHEFKSPVAVAGGKAGGQARVAKGFASPRVQEKAQATRKALCEASPQHGINQQRGQHETQPCRPTPEIPAPGTKKN